MEKKEQNDKFHFTYSSQAQEDGMDFLCKYATPFLICREKNESVSLNISAFMDYNIQWELENLKENIYNIECGSLNRQKFSVKWSGFYGN